MLYFIDIIKQNRVSQGLTQSELAHRARVSLPSVQNIESGKNTNPSWETLQSIFSALGLQLVTETKPADWDSLAACGAPLTSTKSKSVQPTEELLLSSLRSACLELSLTPRAESRQTLAVQAILLALASHFPHFFRKHCRNSSLLMKFYPADPKGPVIKLKRQATAVIASYL